LTLLFPATPSSTPYLNLAGHTDYAARHALITQDKNKYQSPKFRLVVRFSNRYVKVQVVASEIKGDRVLAQATSQELPRYGLVTGLKNYAAAYATGLLCARRLLKELGLDETYTGVEEVDGSVGKQWNFQGEEIEEGKRVNSKIYYVEFEEGADKRPFRCYLDVGIKATTRGAKVFAAMKGASDGGLDIPHNNKRFPGYDPDAKTFDAEDLKDHIMGGHVGQFMEMMEEDDEENYKKVFAKYIENEISADDLEGLYEGVHAKIREDPSRKKGLTFNDEGEQSAFTYKKTGKEVKKIVKLTFDQRKTAMLAKKAAFAAAADEE
jgi:large subunit ribosomal protein L5e